MASIGLSNDVEKRLESDPGRSVLMPHVQARAVFRSIGWNAWGACTFILLALVGFSGVVAGGGGVVAHLALALLAGASLVVSVRSLRAAVVVDTEAVTVRGFVRTYRLPWEDVATIGRANGV